MTSDAKDQRIAELELQLSIATELNVGDRKRIAELEAVVQVVADADPDDTIGRLKVFDLRERNWWLRDAARAVLDSSRSDARAPCSHS